MELLGNFLIVKQVLAPVLAFGVAFYIMPLIIKIAVKKELVAKPNHRTSHKGRIPNIGGVSIFVAFAIAMLFTADIGLFYNLQYFLLGLIFIFFIGLTDDIIILSARKKFMGEILAVMAFVVLGDIRITNLHGFLGISEIPYIFSVFVTIFIALVIINALNLIDGIDGLASGVGIILSLFFIIYFLMVGNSGNTGQLLIISLALFGALIPFFIYNVFGTRNKIFMGDAGALSLGFIVSLLTIEFCQTSLTTPAIINPGTAPIVMICALILPLFDTLRVFIIRALNGKSPFKPDKNHLHHKLLALGLNHKQSTSILLFTNVVFIIIGILGSGLPGWMLFTIIGVLAVGLSEFLRLKLKNKQARERVYQLNYKEVPQ